MATSSSTASSLTRDALFSWPKADLHTHLDGSLRLATMLDLATQQGKLGLLPSDSLEGLEEALKQIDHSESLEAYLTWFRYSIPLLQTEAALRRVAYEMAEDCAWENVHYLEVRYGPILHRDEGLSLEAINDAVLDGLKAAERDFGIRTNVIICGLRDRYESASLRQAELAVAYQHKGVVAFDLAGGEAGNPPKHHLHAFYYARNNLLNLTVHAGESWGPDSIKQALFYCGAHRIGHGITLHQDAELMQYVIDHQIPLELCPTSNVQTKVVKSFEDHPISRFVRAGVPVTVNTDSRLFSRTSSTDELWRVHKRCNINAAELREIAMNGFRYAFLPWDEKQELLRNMIDAFPMPPTPETPVW